MRLIDADALKKEWSMGLGSCNDCPQNTRRCQLDMDFTRMDICGMIDDAPTVDVLPKLWNALYAEEDKFEKRYISTPEHDNWFLFYRPWLQNGFEIAIKVLSEIFVSEPPKEEN